ncbi:MAG TPA: hypothetical protein VK129_07590 [Terriglobales bacterium]|nr:hypothetical protein [Terriglobales bacterium]
MHDPILLPFEDGNLREPYREYFTTKRKNYQHIIATAPELWDCFLMLDKIWVNDLEDMKSVETFRIPIVLLFRHSHQQFRISFELGFSTALTEAFSIMRGSIDTGMVAHKICREPNLLVVWAHKNDGKAEERLFRDTFKSANLFPAQHGLNKLQSFYRDYSEYGTHPGVGALSLHAQGDVQGRKCTHNYLEPDGKKVLAFLFRMLEASAIVEGACFDCFKERLNLDTDLVNMRSELAKRTKESSSAVNQMIAG